MSISRFKLGEGNWIGRVKIKHFLQALMLMFSNQGFEQFYATHKVIREWILKEKSHE